MLRWFQELQKLSKDYFTSVVQKFGKIFTEGLKHSMLLPYQDFEDQEW